MKSRLEAAGLLDNRDNIVEISILTAWTVLARLGLPARYGGKTQDGSFEYLIINPATGNFLATGKGPTLEDSICEAALRASSRLDSS